METPAAGPTTVHPVIALEPLAKVAVNAFRCYLVMVKVTVVVWVMPPPFAVMVIV
jgi:hypothetical protein